MSIAALVSLVIYVLVLGLIIWLLLWVIDQIAPPEPFHKVLRVVVLVVGVILLIGVLLNFIGMGPIVVPAPLKP